MKNIEINKIAVSNNASFGNNDFFYLFHWSQRYLKN